jgi:hypothetical protein
MKLPDHVDILRNLINSAFDKQFARLGFGPSKQIELEKLPQELHPRRRRFDEMLLSHIRETGSYQNGREKLLDELTFTLFNRIAAIMVMEAASLIPPIITKQPEHGDRSFGHKAWLEIRPDMRSEELEGIRDYILHAFNEMGGNLPLYSRIYPYALLPDPISLNEIIDTFNAVEKDPQIGEDIWQSDDVLGWLYESYNNAKKEAFKDSGEKTEYDKVSLQSQVYTPRWVVKFLVDNSLGKLYLEMYPDSEIKNRYTIANASTMQERERKPLHEIKLIDPACGSGNFLLYAFDLFYDLYLDQIENYEADYDEEKIPQLILEHNLHGIDLDDRAVQLAQLGLYIKARKRRRNIGSLQFNVVSSDFYLPKYEDVQHIFEEGTTLDKNQKALIEEIWSDLQYSHKFGSLIRLDEKIKARMSTLIAKREKLQPNMFSDTDLGVEPVPVQRELFLEGDIVLERAFATSFFINLKTAAAQYASTADNDFLANKTRDAVMFLELLNTKYDVATANPPYTDSGAYGPELKAFIEENYKKPYKFHTNLYASFIKRCFEITCADGKLAMIHPLAFMFIKTFEDVRKFILRKLHINIFVHYGPDSKNLFDGAFASAPSFYVLEKSIHKDRNSWFVSLDRYTRTSNEKNKKDFCLRALADYITSVANKHNFSIPQSKLEIIKSWPFIYWISDEFRKNFIKGNESSMKMCSGLGSGNNLRFMRFWWEVNINQIVCKNSDRKKWVPIAKGGPYRKWYGNLWLCVNWANEGYEIRNFFNTQGKLLSRPQNIDYYFTEGISFVKAGPKIPSFRYIPSNSIFDSSSPAIFPDEYPNLMYSIAFYNSKLASYILDCLNPTAGTQIGDIQRIPFVIPKKSLEQEIATLAKTAISIKKDISKFSLVEMDFKGSPITFQKRDSDPKNKIKQYLNYENHLLTQILLNESIIDNKIFEVYELNDDDKAMVLSKVGINIGSLPISTDARDAYLVEKEATKEFPLDRIRSFIQSLPLQKFTGEEREAIENKFTSLYQNNNDLAAFCIRNHINPINVWYWFKQSNVVPQQLMNTLAMEFLADMIRGLLLEDGHGVMPLVPNAGEKILLERIEEKFREKGFSMAQYSSFDEVLGWPINEYINKHFFAALSDHLNLFMYFPKTPFIWHLSSGPEQGFDCYIIIYKWSRDKLMRIRSVYIERRERSLVNRQSDLAGNDSAEAQNEKDKIYKQLREIEAFKIKIDELLAEGYDPKLDDGVGKNIAPLQKKKMIPYDVLNPGQLKKYLNADW